MSPRTPGPNSETALLHLIGSSLGPLLAVSVAGHPAYARSLRAGHIRQIASVSVRGGVLVVGANETRTENPSTGHWNGCLCKRCAEAGSTK